MTKYSDNFVVTVSVSPSAPKNPFLDGRRTAKWQHQSKKFGGVSAGHWDVLAVIGVDVFF